MNQPTPLNKSPDYHILVTKRRKVSLVLSLIMLASYIAFILLIAFKPTLLGMAVSAGSPITLGIPLGLGLIVLAFALTGIYVHLSNTVFDPLTDAARKHAADAKGSGQ